jgi:hypothetical protein
MECKHLEVTTQTIRGIGTQAQFLKVFECALKKQSQMMQLEVYDALFKKGLEGSFVTNDCPVAETEQWHKCPYFKERKGL